MRLSKHLLIVIMSCVLCGMLAAAWFDYQDSASALYQAANAQEQARVAAIASGITITLNRLHSSLSMLGNGVAVEEALRGQPPTDSWNIPKARLARRFADAAAVMPLVKELFVLNPAGELVAGSSPHLGDMAAAIAQQAFFTAALNGISSNGDPLASANGAKSYILAEPVYSIELDGTRGRIEGVIGLDIDLSNMAEQVLQPLSQHHAGTIMVLSPEGMVLMSTEADFVGRNVRQTPLMQLIDTQRAAAPHGMIEYQAGSGTLHAFFSHLQEPDWLIVATVDAAKAMAPARLILKRSIMLHTVCIVLVLLALCIILRRVNRALTAGLDIAQSVLSADELAAASTRGSDEIELMVVALRTAMRRMVDALEMSHEHHRVAEQAQLELTDQMNLAERFNALSIGRERRIVELKREVNQQALLHGLPLPYPLRAAEQEMGLPPSLALDEGLLTLEPDGTSISSAELQDGLDLFTSMTGLSITVCDVGGAIIGQAPLHHTPPPLAEMPPLGTLPILAADTGLSLNTPQLSLSLCPNPNWNGNCANCPICAVCALHPTCDGPTTPECHNDALPIHLWRVLPTSLYACTTLHPDSPRAMTLLVGPVPESLDDPVHPSDPHGEVDETATVMPAAHRKLLQNMRFGMYLVHLICQLAHTRRAAAQKTTELMLRNQLTLSLAEDAELARKALAENKNILEIQVRDSFEALQMTQERLHLLFECAPDAIIGLDEDGCIDFANTAAFELLGYEESDLIGNSLHATVHSTRPDGTPYPYEECHICSAADDHLTVHVQDQVFWRKDGRVVPVDVVVAPIRQGQQFMGTVLFFHDITDTRALEEKMRAIYNSSLDAYLIFDEDRQLIECNPAVQALFKTDRAHFVENFQQFMPPMQPDGRPSDIIPYFDTAFADGLCRFEWMYLDAEGIEIPSEVVLRCIVLRGHKAMFADIHDLRELKRAELAVARERMQLQLIISTSPVGLFLVADGVVHRLNPRVTELSNLHVGDPLHAILINAAERTRIVDEVAAHGYINDVALEVYGPQGDMHAVLLSALAAEWEGATAMLFWMVDITHLKNTERELMLARDMAEEATRTKSNFLAHMGHEIRTPLNAILGMSYLCQQTGMTERQQDCMSKIQVAADALLSIINDILEFSSLESGQVRAGHMPFSLSGMLASFGIGIRTQAERKGIKLHMATSTDVPDALIGDPVRLAQVLGNLCGNAIKFTESGQVDVQVDRESQHEASLTLHFSVRDTGIGMDPQQADMLFQSFTQADGSFTRQHGGAGLGLAICKGLVELMHGRIWVESAPGMGSTFHCILPFTMAEQQVSIVSETPLQPLLDDDLPDIISNLPSSPALAQTYATNTDAPLRILLVEDNEINQEIARELLVHLGLTIETAENGQQALDAACATQYDLILMDIQMPVMDGLESARRIRASNSPGCETVPIIAMTAHAMSGDYEASFAVGMNAHLTKPISPRELYHTIAQWLPQDERTTKLNALVAASANKDMESGTPHASVQAPTGAELAAMGVPASPETGSTAQHIAAQLEHATVSVARPFAHVYGVNTRAGLANVVGNEKLYGDLLRRFAAKYRNCAIELPDLLQADQEAAGRLAHTIKGVAANLGATTLAEMAASLENNIRDGYDITHLLAPYSMELSMVCAAIDQLSEILRQKEAPATTSAVHCTLSADNVNQICTVLSQLPTLMQIDWGQAQEKLDALEPLLHDGRTVTAYTALHDALEEFDVIALSKAADATIRIVRP